MAITKFKIIPDIAFPEVCKECRAISTSLRYDVYALGENKLLCDQCRHKEASQHPEQRNFYLIKACPIAWSRAQVDTRGGKPRFFDGQQMDKVVFGIEMKKQHGICPPFEKPVKFDVIFYMPIPKMKAKKYKEGTFCAGAKDIDNLCKFLYDAAVDAEILKDDNIIVFSTAKKIYSKSPRVEFVISEIL